MPSTAFRIILFNSYGSCTVLGICHGDSRNRHHGRAAIDQAHDLPSPDLAILLRTIFHNNQPAHTPIANPMIVRIEKVKVASP